LVSWLFLHFLIKQMERIPCKGYTKEKGDKVSWLFPHFCNKTNGENSW
jgi:hypothetical protein